MREPDAAYNCQEFTEIVNHGRETAETASGEDFQALPGRSKAASRMPVATDTFSEPTSPVAGI